MPTPDGKYAVLTIREDKKDKEGKDVVDGTLQLFDMQAKKLVGKTTSACFKCHESIGNRRWRRPVRHRRQLEKIAVLQPTRRCGYSP